MLPLADVRIVELSEGIAAPFCAKLLADLGARVLKIEPHPGLSGYSGDAARRAGPFPGDALHPEKSGLFLYTNTSRQSLVIDVDTPAGRARLLELLRNADAFITAMSPKLARQRRLTYAALTHTLPSLVVTSITPFGTYGPRASYKANDFIIGHVGGVTYPNAQEADDPEKLPSLQIPAHLCSFSGGMAGAVATLAALRSRQFDGRGQHVDVSMQEAVATNLRHDVAAYTYARQIPGRI